MWRRSGFRLRSWLVSVMVWALVVFRCHGMPSFLCQSNQGQRDGLSYEAGKLSALCVWLFVVSLAAGDGKRCHIDVTVPGEEEWLG